MPPDPYPRLTPPSGRGIVAETPRRQEDQDRILQENDSRTAGRVPSREQDITDPTSNPWLDISQITQEQAEGPGELLNQESRDEGPSRSEQSEAPPVSNPWLQQIDEVTGEARGTPLPPTQTQNWQVDSTIRAESRIRAITTLFGLDALVLGHLLFQVPPLAIRIKKGNMTYRWKPLRTKESIAVKSGNGECYIEIDLAFVGLDQIQTSLADLISLWNNVPFCFIENVHIRKMMIPDRPEDSMAVCLETMVMDAISGRPNTVYATLLTKWFNYKPYSKSFWFRRDWRPAGTNQPQPNNPRSSGPSSGAGEDRTPEGGANVPDVGNPILTDLSRLQDPKTLDVTARRLPPELGMFEGSQLENPGDPAIDGTYPVVYPFNSEPFMRRVREGDFRPAQINSWSDGIRMGWNRFVRVPVPNNWRYSASQDPPQSVARSTPRNRGRETRVPPPVTGERDMVLFLGDSTMVGFTSLGGRTECKAPSEGGPAYGTPTFFEWDGNSRFPASDGFTYVAMCRNGATSEALVNWWNAKKDDESLKVEGSEESCSKVAGVIIHTGLSDGNAGPNMGAIRTLLSEASGFGAIPILISLPPVGDATDASPTLQSNLRLTFGDSAFNAYVRALPDHHSTMNAAVQAIDNAMLIDSHNAMVSNQFRGNRAAPLIENTRSDDPTPGYYSITWNDRGNTIGGNYIHGELPWNSMRGEEEDTTANQWTVCHIEDGDTVWAMGPHPDTQQTVLRKVRLQFIDTVETYGQFENANYNDGGSSPLPNGQDSYRPDDQKYGLLAKRALESLIGQDHVVTIEWGGTDRYGRYLGVLSRGSLNINLKMVEDGHAFANASRLPEDAEPYVQAERRARGDTIRGETPRKTTGVHAQRTAILDLPDGFDASVALSIARLMKPREFRQLYKPASGGGHTGTPAGCTAELDEAVDDDSGGADPDSDS